MGDYSPVHLPGHTYTSTASGPITGGDNLAVSGANTVARAGAGSTAVIGAAAADAVAGQRVTVISNCVVHRGVAEGAVAAGDQLTASGVAGRHVKSLAASNVAIDLPATYTEATTETTISTAINSAVNAARSVIGVALSSAADGAVVRWAAL